ncbi:GNAT family N-acetyltransferase [Pseudodesulfovibrio sediminis]|uniref:N-acetyltransferase n=1 Tax=Pseudodesulfovibrio sediminis TaxID=2810563 RepID=A0ABN6EX32_9BACT|nr:GNAT family N-acetyltransferase [Pseudodesulfovibrio sediminis]BCS90078.1 N-acetyltransferase [Pseudodesulfovibrio sediminis]
MGITLITKGKESLDQIQPLWEQLNDLHKAVSIHFSAHFKEYLFGYRKAYLRTKGDLGSLRIFMAMNDTELVGYCVASINPVGDGEIESIFVEEAFRRQQVGDMLMTAALKWLDENDVRSKSVAVVFGNEAAHPFYARYGFLPRTTYLAIPED